MQTSVWAFLQELVQRIGAKNPKFFNVLAWIGAIATFLTGLPGLLVQLGISLPPDMLLLQNKVVAWAGLVMIFVSNLATQRPVTSVTQTGSNTLKTDPKVLPFTAAAEKKEAAKSEKS